MVGSGVEWVVGYIKLFMQHSDRPVSLSFEWNLIRLGGLPME